MRYLAVRFRLGEMQRSRDLRASSTQMGVRALDARIDAGDRAEGGRLGELYAKHAAGAIRLGYLLTGDRAIAEDLVQEAFVRIAARLGHLRDPSAFQAYLRSTVINLSRMHHRKQKTERSYLEREANLRPPEGPERDVTVSEAMRTALLRLPERQRAAIVLRFYEDLTDTATGQILRCPPGTVRSLVSRGMETLRREVQR
jgi:RNA polymerase sigma factor (sigma-70 family)